MFVKASNRKTETIELNAQVIKPKTCNQHEKSIWKLSGIENKRFTG